MVQVKMPVPKGPYKAWTKTLTGIDDTQAGGFAFIGDFLQVSRRGIREYDLLPETMLLYYEELERADGPPVVVLFEVMKDGILNPLYENECYQKKGWAKEVLKEIRQIVNRKMAFQPLKALQHMRIAVTRILADLDHFSHSTLPVPICKSSEYRPALETLLYQVEKSEGILRGKESSGTVAPPLVNNGSPDLADPDEDEVPF